MKKLLALALTVGGVALCAAPVWAAHDNFNRQNLGKKWVVPFGSLFITNDQLQGQIGSLGYFKPSANDADVQAIVYLNGTDTEYGAVASGDIATGNNAFVKIQSQNADGLFEYGAFYTGNNGGGDFFALNSTVAPPATLSVSFCSTTAIMKIKSAAGTQKYKFDYGTSFGNGGGLGTYGNISLDNYRSKPGSSCADAKGATLITGSNARDLSLAK